MSAELTIAAKAPLAGHVKTRLARELGDESAVALYRAFLADLGARFPDAAWFVDPLPAWLDAYPASRASAQPAGDWTERQRAFFRGAAERGEERPVLVASDSPQLRSEVVAEALTLLDRYDVVVGPVADGGYYLLGMHGWHDILAGVKMSTGEVVACLLQEARARSLRVALLEPSYDVDELADLELLRLDAARRDDLPATNAALESLFGAPA